jgi:glycosyltransferase involved in cell wall biosynthesis
VGVVAVAAGRRHGVSTDGALELSVVIPVKDEEPNLPLLHEELTRALGDRGISYEVVIVDDGSTDGTFAQLEQLYRRDPRIRVIRFARNFGQTAAFAAGFDAARGRFVATLDGDLQNDPADIPRLLALASRHDIVCGWRRQRHDAWLTRKLPSAIANWLIGLVSGTRLHDNGCSLKVFRADIVKRLNLRPGMHRYLPALAVQLGNGVVEEVVNHRPRRFGRSKYGLSRTFQVVADLVQLPAIKRRAIDQRAPRVDLYQVAQVLDRQVEGRPLAGAVARTSATLSQP